VFEEERQTKNAKRSASMGGAASFFVSNKEGIGSRGLERLSILFRCGDYRSFYENEKQDFRGKITPLSKEILGVST
jgi:hypothetical protein